MLGSIFATIRFIIMLMIIAITLYLTGYLFDWLPEHYAPHQLFPKEFTALKKELSKVAKDNCTFATPANLLYQIIEQKSEIYDIKRKEEAEAEKKAAEAAAKREETFGTGTPQERVQDLMNQVDQRNKVLDEL